MQPYLRACPRPIGIFHFVVTVQFRDGKVYPVGKSRATLGPWYKGSFLLASPEDTRCLALEERACLRLEPVVTRWS